ncbi:hypothetical protein GH721_08880 [Kriegella sp. EG-1]|nr:hypothetical protein [Flavobacteriaceae bacterium EG-1]
MVNCPKCNKSLECEAWPAWGVGLCVLVHRSIDCFEVDDIIEELDKTGSFHPNKKAQYVRLKKKFERELLLKATTNLNRTCIKNLSSQLAYKVVSESNNFEFKSASNFEIKNTIQAKLGIVI